MKHMFPAIYFPWRECMLSPVWFMLLAYASFASPQNLYHDHAFKDKSIFILAGQSNMSGRGGVLNGTWDGLLPPECRPNPQILRLSAGLAWQEAQEPLHRDIDANKTCGIGPGMVFFNSVLEREPGFGVIGLVPCAIGGTNISEWRHGGWLYNQTLARAQAALSSGGTIRAILWYQGESDTLSLEDAQLYKRRLRKFFTHIRSDLGSPLLPVIQVALASGQVPYVEKIREAQLGIDLPNVRCVDAKGLQLQVDGLHLSTTAQVQLGTMMADAFLQFMALLAAKSSAPKRLDNFFLNFLFRLYN